MKLPFPAPHRLGRRKADGETRKLLDPSVRSYRASAHSARNSQGTVAFRAPPLAFGQQQKYVHVVNKVPDLVKEIADGAVQSRRVASYSRSRRGAVVPQTGEDSVRRSTWSRIHDENRVRQEIGKGMKASKASHVYGVL